MKIKIEGDKWSWIEEYNGKEYGDTVPYDGETQEELEAYAKREWNECKNILKTL